MDKDLALIALVILGLTAMLMIQRFNAQPVAAAAPSPQGTWVLERDPVSGKLTAQIVTAE